MNETLHKESEEKMSRNYGDGPSWGGIVCTLAIILLIGGGGIGVLGWTSAISAPVGYVAIVEDAGAGTVAVYGTGNAPVWLFAGTLHPLVNQKLMYVSTETAQMWGASEAGEVSLGPHENLYPEILTITSDGLEIGVDVTVRWRLNASMALSIYQKFPAMNWRDTLIIPTIREVARNVITTFTGFQIIENRSQVDFACQEAMREAFNNLPTIPGAVIYEEMNMRNIGLPETFTAAIEEKLAAEQAVLTAMFYAESILIAAQADADALVIGALAAANATIINANATAQATLLQSMAIADAVALIANVTGANATQLAQMYLYMQMMQNLANSTGNTTFFIFFGGDGTPFILPLEPQS